MPRSRSREAESPSWIDAHSVQPYFDMRPSSRARATGGGAGAPVVGLDQGVEVPARQRRLAPDVAELEARVVVAGVLVVDEPQPRPSSRTLAASRSLLHGTVGERARRERGRGSGRTTGRKAGVAGGQAEAALLHHGEVAALQGEHVEVARRTAGRRAAPGRPRRPGRRFASSRGRPGSRAGIEPVDDEDAAARRARRRRGRRHRGAMPVVAAAALSWCSASRSIGEQRAVRAGEPGHVLPSVTGRDLEIAVRQTAGERRDCSGPAANSGTARRRARSPS